MSTYIATVDRKSNAVQITGSSDPRVARRNAENYLANHGPRKLRDVELGKARRVEHPSNLGSFAFPIVEA